LDSYARGILSLVDPDLRLICEFSWSNESFLDLPFKCFRFSSSCNIHIRSYFQLGLHGRCCCFEFVVLYKICNSMVFDKQQKGS